MPLLQILASGPTTPTAGNPTDPLPHVLLVVDGFPKVLGGGERIVLRVAELLPRYGYRASILTFTRHPDSEFRLEAAPCPVYLLPLTNTYGPRALVAAFSLGRFLRKERVAVVQTFFESSDIWGGFVTRLSSSARLIWSRRDMGILRSAKHHRAYRALRRFPHAVMAVSGRVAQHTREVDGLPVDRIHVVYNGLDLENLPPRQAAPDTLSTIACVGNIRHVKGHDLLVEAAAMVCAEVPEAKFILAGEVLEPVYFEQLKSRLHDLGLTSRFTFAGRITQLPQFLSQAAIFALPSRSEGFSNALIEAMACGLAPVATDVGGNGEAIENGRNGFLVPPDDAQALAQALLTLLRNPALAETLRAAARTTVQERFTLDAMMRATVKVYAEVLNNAR